MSVLEERFLKSAIYNSGDVFTAAKAASSFTTRKDKPAQKTIQVALNNLVKRGFLAEHIGQGSRNSTTYSRRRSVHNPLTSSWRKHSNEDLGIE